MVSGLGFLQSCHQRIVLVFSYSGVAQLLLAYGPFYKNLRICSLLPTKWRIKQQLHKV